MKTFGFYRRIKSKWETVALCQEETLNGAGKIFAAQGLNQWEDNCKIWWHSEMIKQKNFRK
jgi:hypothetical protein